jgi:hypothetical protein
MDLEIRILRIYVKILDHSCAAGTAYPSGSPEFIPGF